MPEPEPGSVEDKSPGTEQYRAAAKRLFHEEGRIEVDPNAVVSYGADEGAYVQAWVWVDEDELEE